MNETQKRREQLLKNTRQLYESGYGGSTVHPRYQTDYSFREKESEQKSSLGIRLFFSMVMFLIFAAAEQYDENLFFILSEYIIGK